MKNILNFSITILIGVFSLQLGAAEIDCFKSKQFEKNFDEKPKSVKQISSQAHAREIYALFYVAYASEVGSDELIIVKAKSGKDQTCEIVERDVSFVGYRENIEKKIIESKLAKLPKDIVEAFIIAEVEYSIKGKVERKKYLASLRDLKTKGELFADGEWLLQKLELRWK